jgi:hypothetical protein
MGLDDHHNRLAPLSKGTTMRGTTMNPKTQIEMEPTMNNSTSITSHAQASTLAEVTRAVLTSKMTATARLLVLTVHINADDTGWWLASYADLSPFIDRTSTDGISAAIKDAKKHEFLIAEREQDTFKEIKRNIPAMYKVNALRSPIIGGRDDVQRMSPIIGGRDETLVSSQVSPSPKIGDTNTSNLGFKNQNQNQNQNQICNPPTADTTPICVSGSLREHEDEKTKTSVTNTNPHTKPRQRGNVRIDGALCFTCDNRNINIRQTKTGKTVTWCSNCDPDWYQTYEEAVTNWQRWDTEKNHPRPSHARPSHGMIG